MSEEGCIRRGLEVLENAKSGKNAAAAFRASYYFFWGKDFYSAKRALGTAYRLKGETYLPADPSRLMELSAHSGLRHSFETGFEDILRMPAGRLRTGKSESALRQGGFGDEERGLLLEYIDFDPVVFLRAYLLYLEG